MSMSPLIDTADPRSKVPALNVTVAPASADQPPSSPPLGNADSDGGADDGSPPANASSPTSACTLPSLSNDQPTSVEGDSTRPPSAVFANVPLLTNNAP